MKHLTGRILVYNGHLQSVSPRWEIGWKGDEMPGPYRFSLWPFRRGIHMVADVPRLLKDLPAGLIFYPDEH